MERALIGAGGHAREIKAHMKGPLMKCFVDDEYWVENDEHIHPLSQFNPKEYKVIIAIGNPRDRYDMVQRLPKETKYFTFIHPSSQILGNDVSIGEGAFVGANVIVTTNVNIGKHALLNRASQIGHDVVIGDYFSAMPNSVVSGNVKIYDLVYLGTNASVKEKLSIHSLSIIGLNSGVVKNIEEPGIYGGVPAKKIK